MKNSGDSTHPYRSPAPATVKGSDLTLLIWTQTSDQEYSDLTASNRRPSTPYSATLHKPFHEEPGRMLSRVRQSMCRRVWHTPKIEIWSVVLGPGRKPHWVSFSFDSIILQHLFSRHLAT